MAGVRRRRAASRRLPVLEHSRVADPWTPWRPDVLSDPQADGVVAAAEHLAIAGLAPLFDATTLRQMWRRGGDDRALAEELHRLTDGVIA
ncbi:hypothetical protein JDV09_21095 [Mycobacterium sp. Y57]|nr:hypothetical protein [Mycolicibacterium xanthum]